MNRYRELQRKLRPAHNEDVLLLTIVAYIDPGAPRSAIPPLLAATARRMSDLIARRRVVLWRFDEFPQKGPPRTLGEGKCQLSELATAIEGCSPPIESTSRLNFVGDSHLRRVEGGYYARSLIVLGYEENNFSGRFMARCHPQHYLYSTIGFDLVAERPVSDIVAYVEDIMRLLDSSGLCVQALCEAAWANESSGGRFFTKDSGEPVGWHRVLEHAEWITGQERRLERLRGVYWGAYLGRDLASRAGIDEAFIDAFLKQGTFAVGTQAAMLLPNGAFFRMSDDPLTMVPILFFDDSETVCNAVWLRKELRERGVM